jgi:Leucine-rich repeat (LRR) protein
MSEISSLSSCTRLKTLILERSKVTDLSSLLSMPLLEEVDVTFCSIKNVSPLSHCKRLQKLGIGGNEGIKDLSPLCQ